MNNKEPKITQRVLITLEDYEYLKDVEMKYDILSGLKKNNHQNENLESALSTDGGQPGSSQNVDLFEHGQRLVPKEMTILKKVEIAEDKITNSVRAHHLKLPSLPRDIFVKFVRKPYKTKALQLLKKLEEHKLIFSYDNYGILTIDGNRWEGSSLFELLPITFAPRKIFPKYSKEWRDLLEKLSLLSFVKNKKLLNISENQAEKPPTNFLEDSSSLEKIPPNRKWYQI